MNKYMPNATPYERLQALQLNADKVETTTYQKPLTEDDLNDRREIIADNCIKLNDLSEQKKDAVRTFKDTMDPLIQENNKILTQIRTKQVEAEGRLFHIANHESKMMETFDEEGLLVSSRRLKATEMQQDLFRGGMLSVAQ